MTNEKDKNTEVKNNKLENQLDKSFSGNVYSKNGEEFLGVHFAKDTDFVNQRAICFSDNQGKSLTIISMKDISAIELF
jgi:hypothetical protein